MDESSQRPSKQLIKNAYDHLFNSGLSLPKMRDSALADRLLPSMGDSIQLAGRSIAWKILLTLEEPLQSSSPLRSEQILERLRASRKTYVNHLCRHMQAPDGSYDETFVPPGSVKGKQLPKAVSNLETNNPLSLHRENPWKEWFAAVELRKTILQDVERTFPDIGFFRHPEVHLQLSNILFLYSAMNSSIGYRQGMHEVLAPLFYSVDFDSLSEDDDFGTTEMREICSRTWVAADAWSLFDKVMRGLSKFYEWRESPLPTAALSPLRSHLHLAVPDGPMQIKPYVAPIVDICNRIQAELLQPVDPVLWKNLHTTGIEPQIYGIRWLRLLFTREFSMSDALRLWDSLFASDPSLELTQWVCVAMLIRIRNELISAEYSSQLTSLLRYNSPRTRPTFEGAPHHATLLVRQALALQMAPSPSTGASLVLENRNLLNIPAEISLLTTSQRVRTHQSKAVVVRGHSGGTSPTPPPSLPEVIARGWAGESFGINKTLMTAVSELTRNIPDLTSSLVRSPSTPYSSFPLLDDHSHKNHSPSEHGRRHEAQREFAQLQSRDKKLGESLVWIVDTLLQDEAESQDAGRLRLRKQEALESLSYIRDVLIGNAHELEEDRLLEAIPSEKQTPDDRQESVAVKLSRPVPVPVVDSKQRVPRSLAHRGGSSSSKHELQSSTSSRPPWNYTPSSSLAPSPSLQVEGLPRLPPSSTQMQDFGTGEPVRSNVSLQDPLGALK